VRAVDFVLGKILLGDRFIAVIDPLGFLSASDFDCREGMKVIFRPEDEIDFRLQSEPIRDQQDKGESIRFIAIFDSEDELPPDLKKKAKIISLKVSDLLPSLHPIVDHLIPTKEHFRRLRKDFSFGQSDLFAGISKSYQETVDFVLGKIHGLSPSSSIEDVVYFLLRWHFKGDGQKFPEGSLKIFTEAVGSRSTLPQIEDFLLDRDGFISWLSEAIVGSIIQRATGRSTPSSLVKLSFSTRLSEMLDEVLPKKAKDKILDELKLEESEKWDIESLDRGVLQIPIKFARDAFDQELAKRLVEEGRLPDVVHEHKAIYRTHSETKITASALQWILRYDYPKDPAGWASLGRQLAALEISIDELNPDVGNQLRPRFEEAVTRANRIFSEYVGDAYQHWLQKPRPLMNIDILRDKVFPDAMKGGCIAFLVFDGMSYDHWLVMKPVIEELLGTKAEDEPCFTTIPTITTFARNAIFAGAFTREIVRSYSPKWLESNNYEQVFFHDLRPTDIKGEYKRYSTFGKSERNDLKRIVGRGYPVLAVVLNFIDTLITLAGQADVNKRLLRSFVREKFKLSPIADAVRDLYKVGYSIFITSDHGNASVIRTVKVEEAEKLEARRSRCIELSKELRHVPDGTIMIKNPDRWGLPDNGKFLIAVDPIKFDRVGGKSIDYVAHGGISLQEMVVPFVKIVHGG